MPSQNKIWDGILRNKSTNQRIVFDNLAFP
jgi:hypothetical protein